MSGALPAGWDASIPSFPADAKGVATRAASGKILNAIATKLPTLIGGSADLNPSTFTVLPKLGDFESPERKFTDKSRLGGRRLGIMPDAICISACASTAWARR